MARTVLQAPPHDWEESQAFKNVDNYHYKQTRRTQELQQ